MKKLTIWILMGLLIILLMVLYVYCKKPTNKKNKVDYVCTLNTLKNDNIMLENLYIFSYEKNKVVDYSKQFRVTYQNEKEYNEAYYTTFFTEKDPVDEIKSDDINLIRTYIWHYGFKQDDKDDSVEKYLDSLEQLGYACHIK